MGAFMLLLNENSIFSTPVINVMSSIFISTSTLVVFKKGLPRWVVLESPLPSLSQLNHKEWRLFQLSNGDLQWMICQLYHSSSWFELSCNGEWHKAKTCLKSTNALFGLKSLILKGIEKESESSTFLGSFFRRTKLTSTVWEIITLFSSLHLSKGV